MLTLTGFEAAPPVVTLGAVFALPQLPMREGIWILIYI